MTISQKESSIKILDIVIIFFMIFVLTDPELENISLIYYASMALVFARAVTLIQRRIRIDAFYIWYIVLLLIYGISCLYASKMYYALDMYKTIIFRFVFYFYIYNIVRCVADIECIMKIMIISSLLMTVHALAISNMKMLIYFPLGVTTLNELWNANSIANYAMFSALFALYFLVVKKERNDKFLYLYVVIYFYMLFIQLLTRSKSAVLISGIVTIGVLYINNKKNILKLVISVLAIVIIFIVVSKTELFYEFVGKNFNEFIDYFAKGTGRGSYESTSMRMEMIKFGLEKAKESPIFGYGLNNYRDLFSYTTWNVYGIGGVYAHNNYIELLVNNGIIGLISYYSIYVYLIKKLKKKKDKISLIFLGMLLVFLISDIAKVSYYMMAFQIWICLICKYIILRNDENRKYCRGEL